MSEPKIILRKKFLNKKKVTLGDFIKESKKNPKQLHVFMLNERLYRLGQQNIDAKPFPYYDGYSGGFMTHDMEGCELDVLDIMVTPVSNIDISIID